MRLERCAIFKEPGQGGLEVVIASQRVARTRARWPAMTEDISCPPSIVIPAHAGFLFDADNRTPDSRKNCSHQNIKWVRAKGAAVSTHLNAKGTDLMVTCGIKQSGEDN